MPGTTSTTQRGRVQFYNAERKFGFIQLDGERVLFHMDDCREVEGTPEEPVLTDRASDREPTWSKRMRREAQELVFQVQRTGKGLKATAWGFVPVRTWLEDLIRRDILAHYGQGYVKLLYSEHHMSRTLRTVVGSYIEPPRITLGDPTELTMKLNVHDWESIYGKVTGELQVAFDLVEVLPGESSQGTCTMHIKLSKHGWVQVVFYPTRPQMY